MIPLLFACAAESAPATSGGSGDEATVECGDEVAVEVNATHAGTAPRLTWETNEAVSSWVEFTNGDRRTRESAAGEAATTHDVVLLGILPSVEFAWQIMVSDADGERCVAKGTAMNGPLPAGVPEVTTVVGEARSPGLTVAPVLAGAPQTDNWIVIFDEEGCVVWAYAASAEIGGAVFVTTAAFSRDGLGVLYNTQALSATTPGWIGRVNFDGAFEQVATVMGLHTDFAEMDDGRIAALTWEVRDVGAWRILGDHVVVIDAEGGATSIWNSFDSLPFDEDYSWNVGFYAADPTVADWSHVNRVAWDAESDDLMLTMTAQNGLARIDAQTGEMAWLDGDGVGDFDVTAGMVVAPHSAELLEDGHILVFNRGDFLNDPLNACSWASELVFDADAGTVGETDRWAADDCTLVTYLGLATRLPGDMTLVDWTSAGRIDQFTAGNEPVWSVALGAGHAFGYADFLATP